MSKTPIIETVGLTQYFNTAYGTLHAVEDVNLKIYPGQTLGVVGESGCGKSTLGRVIIQLLAATKGQILYNGKNILELDKKEKWAANRDIQMIFQDPYSSLNPRLSVGAIIADPILSMEPAMKKRSATAALKKRVLEVMDEVGLPERYFYAYPHELDGGRRQRIGLARALALDPKFIIGDEPVSALDVSIQAQILNLMMDLQEKKGLSYMFITHNLLVVKHISDQIMVMYMGQMVEYADKNELFSHPTHPYTRALLDAMPMPNLAVRKSGRNILKGEVSNPINPKPGCRFASRCEFATEKCTGDIIPLKEVSPNHLVACVL
jgi:peptide/nickel transport system ATP-binding protein